MSKVSKMTSEECTDALPYSKPVGRVLCIFVLFLFAALLCQDLQLEFLTSIFGTGAMIFAFATFFILCEVKLTGGGPDEDSLKVSKMTSRERFNALPYSKRVGKALRIFFSLVVATGICAALQWEFFAGIFMLVTGVYGFATVVILCGGKYAEEFKEGELKKVKWAILFNALPYPVRVRKMLRIFFPLVAATVLCFAVVIFFPQDFLALVVMFLGIATFIYMIRTLFVICGGKFEEEYDPRERQRQHQRQWEEDRRRDYWDSYPNYTDPTSPYYYDR